MQTPTELDLVKKLLEVFSGLLTPVLAVIASIILVKQYRVEKNRWRLALYDKRYAVYEAAMSFIAGIVRTGTATNEALFEYLRACRDKEFLFGSKVQELLGNIYNKANEIVTADSLLKSNLPANQVADLCQRKQQLQLWLGKQFEVTKAEFSPYLAVND
jgi:hypothetical protein